MKFFVSKSFFALLAIATVGNQSVWAQTTENWLDHNLESDPLAQITSVSELRDVAPDAWAYEALSSLVERYGCIVGYPDRTFRGDRGLSRWEFAAGLNACLNVMERLIRENSAVMREDIDKLQRLTQAFAPELASLGARVDNLEFRTARLEDQQFSTTTKLSGEVVMALSGVASGKKNDGEDTIPKITTFAHRTRLELNTSFTGRDNLYTRLASGNIAELAETAGTFQSNLAFSQPDDNNLGLEVLFYNFPLSDSVQLWVTPAGGAFDDFTSTVNVLDGDGALGALSAFGTRNPIYYLGGGAGLGMQGTWNNLEWSLGYLAGEGNDPRQGAGLFNGPYGAIAQVGYNFNDKLNVALTYAHGYNSLDTGTGSQRSNFQFFAEDRLGQAVPTVHNAYGVEMSWKLSEHFVLGGWGGLTKAKTLAVIETDKGVIGRGDLDIWNWAVTLAFPDLIREGNMGGIIVGMQPWLSTSSLTLPDGLRATDQDSSLHLEGFFQWAMSDNWFITPGILVIPNADFDSRNETLVIGAIRTTFTF